MEPLTPARITRYADVASMHAAAPVPQREYESAGVVLLEDSGIRYDEAFIQALAFPPEWKKVGALNGITKPPLVLEGGRMVRTDNPLCAVVRNDVELLKVYSELRDLEMGFRLLLAELFPGYRLDTLSNVTFRFTPTTLEPVHLDSYGRGVPTPPEQVRPRVKLFLNVDRKPRVWNVGPTLPDLIAASAGTLGTTLPTDVNRLCDVVNRSGLLERVPFARLEIPPRGIVFANGPMVVHQVVSGDRMVSLEGFVPRSALLPESRYEGDCTREWIEAAGYTATD
jgi:hypothetical protein